MTRCFIDHHSIHTWRRAIQISVAITFAVLPILNALGFKLIWGNFLNIHVGTVAFSDPLAVLQVAIINQYFTPKFIISAGLVLGIALMLGTVFCSWMCPFGLLSEWFHALSDRILPRNTKRLGFRRGFLIKLTLFTVGLCAIAYLFRRPLLNQMSMPFAYSQIFQYLYTQKQLAYITFFVVIVLIIEFIGGARVWCRCICPQSVFLTLVKNLNPMRLKVAFNSERCLCRKSETPCQRACSLALDPTLLNRVWETECNNCGACVDACLSVGQALCFQWRVGGSP
jgi:ferredoxin-type protein NapH